MSVANQNEWHYPLKRDLKLRVLQVLALKCLVTFNQDQDPEFEEEVKKKLIVQEDGPLVWIKPYPSADFWMIRDALFLYPCGLGKTLLAIQMMAVTGGNILITVHSNIAVNQWRDDLFKHLDVETRTDLKHRIICLTAGKASLPIIRNKPIIVIVAITNIRFAKRRSKNKAVAIDTLKKIKWQTIILDEAHLVTTKKSGLDITKVTTLMFIHLHAKFRFMFTAYIPKSTQGAINSLFGRTTSLFPISMFRAIDHGVVLGVLVTITEVDDAYRGNGEAQACIDLLNQEEEEKEEEPKARKTPITLLSVAMQNMLFMILRRVKRVNDDKKKAGLVKDKGAGEDRPYKLLLFTTNKKNWRIIENVCRLVEISYTKVVGQDILISEREPALENFKSVFSGINVLIMSQIGSTGINVPFVNGIVMLNSSLQDISVLQSIGRGQRSAIGPFRSPDVLILKNSKKANKNQTKQKLQEITLSLEKSGISVVRADTSDIEQSVQDSLLFIDRKIREFRGDREKKHLILFVCFSTSVTQKIGYDQHFALLNEKYEDWGLNIPPILKTKMIPPYPIIPQDMIDDDDDKTKELMLTLKTRWDTDVQKYKSKLNKLLNAVAKRDVGDFKSVTIQYIQVSSADIRIRETAEEEEEEEENVEDFFNRSNKAFVSLADIWKSNFDSADDDDDNYLKRYSRNQAEIEANTTWLVPAVYKESDDVQVMPKYREDDINSVKRIRRSAE